MLVTHFHFAHGTFHQPQPLDRRQQTVAEQGSSVAPLLSEHWNLHQGQIGFRRLLTLFPGCAAPSSFGLSAVPNQVLNLSEYLHSSWGGRNLPRREGRNKNWLHSFFVFLFSLQLIYPLHFQAKSKRVRSSPGVQESKKWDSWMCPQLGEQDAAPRALAQLFFTLTQDRLPTHPMGFPP